MTKTILVGCGAGFANDRPDAALRLAQDLAQRNGQRYIMLELLAERTLAEAQLRRASPLLPMEGQPIPGPPRSACEQHWQDAIRH